MKNLFKLLLLTGIGIVFILQSCKKEEKEPEPNDINIFDVSNDTDWDYWAVGKDGDYLFVKEENSLPKEIFFKPENDKEGYPIFLDDNGLPEKVVIENYIFLFGNYNGNKVDISIISPNGNIEMVRDIETEIDWSTLALKSAKSVEDWRGVLKWSGNVAGGVACGLSVAATVASGGAGLPLTIIGCGANIVGIVTEFLPADYEILGFSATTVGAVTAAIGCVQSVGISCALDVASTATSIVDISLDHIAENEENIRVGEAALYTGHGDIQITLTWDNGADLDLHVTDPSGEEIWWDEPYSSSGGILDYDDIDGLGPENIYWPKNSAPSGNYSVYIHHFVWEDEPSRPTSSNYTVLVSAYGRVAKYTGSIMLNESIHITEFNQNGIKSARIGHGIDISKKKLKKK
ncbi:MAG: hypothetical protein WC384_11455 [Prolixibacteraceae bacterium]|jgi:hypothetical protein